MKILHYTSYNVISLSLFNINLFILNKVHHFLSLYLSIFSCFFTIIICIRNLRSHFVTSKFNLVNLKVRKKFSKSTYIYGYYKKRPCVT